MALSGQRLSPVRQAFLGHIGCSKAATNVISSDGCDAPKERPGNAKLLTQSTRLALGQQGETRVRIPPCS